MMQRVILCTLVASWAMGALSAMVNSEIKRIVDLTKSVVRINDAITIDGHQRERTYEVMVPEELEDNLAWLSVSNGYSLNRTSLPIARVKNKNGYAVYAVQLGEEERNSEPLHLDVLYVFTDILKPLPKTLTQDDPHKVLFESTSLVPSPYETTEQETDLYLSKGKTLLTHSGQQPITISQSRRTAMYGSPKLQCGPYKFSNPAWNSGETLSVHFISTATFIKANNVVREIEVSHWGNIAVEEDYEVEHNGAKLIGEFSRHEHVKKIWKGDTADMGLAFTLETRYPMYGGWSTSWYMGYNLHCEKHLRFKSGVGREKFLILAMPFGLPFNEMWAKDITVKVILPEGAKNIKATTLFKVQESRSKRFTYLDSSIGGGRPVVILKMHNIVKEHNQPFTVSYTFNDEHTTKPFLLVLVVMGFLIIHMIHSFYVRGGRNFGTHKLRKSKSQ